MHNGGHVTNTLYKSLYSLESLESITINEEVKFDRPQILAHDLIEGITNGPALAFLKIFLRNDSY